MATFFNPMDMNWGPPVLQVVSIPFACGGCGGIFISHAVWQQVLTPHHTFFDRGLSGIVGGTLYSTPIYSPVFDRPFIPGFRSPSSPRSRPATTSSTPSISCMRCMQVFSSSEELNAHLVVCVGIPVNYPVPEEASLSPFGSQWSIQSTAEERTQHGETNGYVCPICREAGTSLSAGPCGHVMCTQCFGAALGAYRRCPLCRRATMRDELLRVYL